MGRIAEYFKARREQGRGRRVWLPLAVVVLVSVTWMSLGAEGRSRYGHRGAGVGHGGERSLAEVATQLRQHPWWVTRAGLTSADSDRVAALLDSKNDVFESFRARREVLTAQVAEVLGAPTIDSDRLLTLREDVQRLTTEVTDETLLLFVSAVEDLPAAQRTELLRHWRQVEGR